MCYSAETLKKLISHRFLQCFVVVAFFRIRQSKVQIFAQYIKFKLNFEEIINIKKYCFKKKIKFYLSNNYKIAIKLGLDGAYIPSFNKNTKHLAYSLKKKFKIVGSAHNLKEIRTKEIQKVDKIFLSSLFKKNKNHLGINKFKLLSQLTRKEVVVLGGISKKNLKKLKILNQSKFAGISYFEQKKGP